MCSNTFALLPLAELAYRVNDVLVLETVTAGSCLSSPPLPVPCERIRSITFPSVSCQRTLFNTFSVLSKDLSRYLRCLRTLFDILGFLSKYPFRHPQCLAKPFSTPQCLVKGPFSTPSEFCQINLFDTLIVLSKDHFRHPQCQTVFTKDTFRFSQCLLEGLYLSATPVSQQWIISVDLSAFFQGPLFGLECLSMALLFYPPSVFLPKDP